jgi:O-antigen/teichoic acid export membrane protein
MTTASKKQETDNKRIAKNTLFLYLRMMAMMFIGLFTSRVILDSLGIIDFGIYNVVGSLVLIFTFIQGSLASSASRFLSYEIGAGTSSSLNKIFCMTMNIHLIFACLLFIFSETIGIWYFYEKMVIPENRITAAMTVYQLSNFSAILSVISVPYRSLIIAKEHMKAFAYISIFEGLGKLLIAYCLYISSIDKLILYGILLFVMQLIVNIIYIKYCKDKFKESLFRKFWNKQVFKEMFAFSGWSVCSYISTGVVSQVYNLMLNLFFGPVVNAARAISFQVQSAVNNFVVNFQTALNPQIVKNYAANDYSRVYNLIILSSKVSFSLMLILLFPLLVNIDYILSIWLVEVPEDSNIFIILICISSIFASFGNPLSVVAEAANRLKFYNIVTMPLYILPVLLSYYLLIIGNPASTVFIITIFVEFIAFFLKLWIVKRLINIPTKEISFLYFKSTFTILITMGFGYYIKQSIIPSLIISLILVITCFILSVIWLYYFILSNNERVLIIQFIKNKFKK